MNLYSNLLWTSFPWRTPHRAAFTELFACNSLLHGDLLVEPLKWVLTLHLLKLYRRVLVQELVNREIASAHSDIDLVLLDFD